MAEAAAPCVSGGEDQIQRLNVKRCTNVNYSSQLSLQLAFIIAALQIKKRRWTVRWIFFQAVNRCRAALRTQLLNSEVTLFPCNKERKPPKQHHPAGNAGIRKKMLKREKN